MNNDNISRDARLARAAKYPEQFNWIFLVLYDITITEQQNLPLPP